MASNESSSNLMVISIALYFLYILALAFHRLYNSPLAKFPGPKLAALTSWYEFYYDCIRKGRFTWKIKALHDQYGPIVRITPHELHISEPNFSDELYSFKAKLDRYEGATRHFGMDDATVFAVPYDEHKLRRSALAPFFARSVISTSSCSDLIQGKVEKLCSRIEQFRGKNQPMNIGLAFKCLATDVISEYALRKSYDLLDTPDFSAAWFEAQRDTGRFVLLAKHFSWLIPLLRQLPAWLITMLSPEMGKSLANGKAIAAQVTEIAKSQKSNPSPPLHPTLFHHLLSSTLPPSSKTIPHLTNEGIVVLGAGSDTTGTALTVTTFHILHNPTIHRILRRELTAAFPNPLTPPTWPALEALPYLTAVIKEGLRLSYGTSNRLPRVSNTPIRFQGWTIPPRTPVSMSPMLVHEDETLFPDHQAFKPERWLDPVRARVLERYLMTFGKGPRACLGRELAMAELYLTLACVVRRFELELWETGREDVDARHDFMVPCPRLGSRGVRVLVR